jgi:protein-disulfide isomerase
MKLVRLAAATKRGICRVAPAGLLALALATTAALADDAKPAPETAPAAAAMVPIDQLMAPGPLPDIVEGSPSAAVTIVEYASMTCSHCAAFHQETWPGLKAKYVDSGKVKFILREFPLDPLAAAGFMLARCAGPDKRDAMIDRLFAKQNDWAFVDQPVERLLALVEKAGMSQTDFETCLSDQKLYDAVNQSREQATERFAIDSTPTFFVNGRKLSGETTISEFDQVLEPLLK